MKTSMTNFDIAAILPELRKQTIGGRIHNVYQITPEAFLFKIHPANLNLVIEPAKRIHLTRFEVKTPAKPSQLCMAFRKHVRSAKIVDLQQPNFERLVSIAIERHGERHRIVVELLPRGNVILVDDHDRVVVSSKYIRMKDRSILRGQPLKLPPQRGKNLLEATVNQVTDLRKLGETEAVKAFPQAFGVGGVFAEEILQRAGIDKSLPVKDLSDAQIESLFHAISELKNAITMGAQSPAIVLDNDHIIDVTPFELDRYKEKRKKTFASFNDAVDEYFTAVSSTRLVEERGSSYIAKRQQLERRLDAQKSQLQEITNSARMFRTMGDLIFRHLNEIQAVLGIVTERRRLKQPIEEITRPLLKEGADGSRAYQYVHEVTARGERVTFAFDDTRIEVETRRKPQDQAAGYYAKAKHLEAKLSGLEASTKETQLLLEKLASKEVELKQPIAPEVRQEKEWFEKFRWFHSSEGLLVVGGRDAASNETLLKRYTDPQDLVMHAEVHGAPFFVVKTEGTEAKPETLREAAQACVSYSRLWKEGVHSGDAYWVRPDQVTKSAPPGEYLTRGAFMIRGTRNYLRGVELGLAVGMATYDGRFLIMAGPPTAVRSRCQVYIEIRQGRGSPAETARRILAILRKKSTETVGTHLTRINMDDVIRLLPSGGVETANSISP